MDFLCCLTVMDDLCFDINIRYIYSIFYLPIMDLSYLFLFYRRSVLSGILIFYFSVNRLFVVFSAIEEIQSYIKISSTYLNTLIKIIGITYIAEFTSSICKDAGYAAIASQIEMFGKLSILAVSMPVILALLKTVQNILDFA